MEQSKASQTNITLASEHQGLAMKGSMVPKEQCSHAYKLRRILPTRHMCLGPTCGTQLLPAKGDVCCSQIRTVCRVHDRNNPLRSCPALQKEAHVPSHHPICTSRRKLFTRIIWRHGRGFTVTLCLCQSHTKHITKSLPSATRRQCLQMFSSWHNTRTGMAWHTHWSA
jgi:hypothetical protein